VFSREQYNALRHRAATLVREDRRIIALTGGDRLTYLQGLLTNDVAALQPGSGCYAALLTPQGRMIADMRVFETGERVLIDLHQEAAQAVKDKLEQFIFSEDAQVEDLTHRLTVIGVYGPQATSIAARAFETNQPLDNLVLFGNRELVTDAGLVTVVRSDDIGVDGFDVLAENTNVPAVTSALEREGAIPVNRDTVEITRVEAGRPAWHQDMDESTIPLEAGIEDRAISLTKGCYVGQEIIIRVLHRGHGRVARRLVGLRLTAGDVIPNPGDAIRAGDREIGAVTSAVFSPAVQTALALGYVHRNFVEPSTAVTISHDGQRLDAAVIGLPLVELLQQRN
jgi:folate-binding protein YgfZ